MDAKNEKALSLLEVGWIPSYQHAYNDRIMGIRIAKRSLRSYRRISRVLEALNCAALPWARVLPGSAMPRGNIVVFPGSFNPPTLAHLALLRQARKFAGGRGGRWQVYAALSKSIVDKETVERMTLLDRVVLLERILKSEAGRTGIVLLNRGLYVEQAQGIRAAFPGVRRLSFLVGFDKVVQILDARYYTDREAALCELFGLAQLLVAPRGVDGEEELKELLAHPENHPYARWIAPLPLEERYRHISSTQIRQGEDTQLSAVPAQARDFVWRTRPYAVPLCQTGGTEIDLYARRTRELQNLFSEGEVCGETSDG